MSFPVYLACAVRARSANAEQRSGEDDKKQQRNRHTHTKSTQTQRASAWIIALSTIQPNTNHKSDSKISAKNGVSVSVWVCVCIFSEIWLKHRICSNNFSWWYDSGVGSGAMCTLFNTYTMATPTTATKLTCTLIDSHSFISIVWRNEHPFSSALACWLRMSSTLYESIVHSKNKQYFSDNVNLLK